MAKKYLRQLKTGTIYIRTPELAARPDMVPYDEETALKRIDALKNLIQERKQAAAELAESGGDEAKLAIEVSKKLAELEEQANSLVEMEKKAFEAISEETEEEKEIRKADGIKTEEEILEEQRQERIDNDKEIVAIRAMTNKNQVMEHVLRLYGRDMDRTKKLSEMKEFAIGLRIARMDEQTEE